VVWCHFYYVPKQEQAYQLLQLATSMCIDLGLNLRPREAAVRKIGLRLDHYREGDVSTEPHDNYFSADARRAYIGCYYISTM
jgi:hypothetical protein